MKTLDEVIKAYEICMSDESKTTNCKGCPYADESGDPLCLGEDKEDVLHYLEAYRQLSRGLVSENTEIRPEGIYCKVCGTRLDKDLDDENLG